MFLPSLTDFIHLASSCSQLDQKCNLSCMPLTLLHHFEFIWHRILSRENISSACNICCCNTIWMTGAYLYNSLIIKIEACSMGYGTDGAH